MKEQQTTRTVSEGSPFAGALRARRVGAYLPHCCSGCLLVLILLLCHGLGALGAESFVITNTQSSEPITAFAPVTIITNHPPWDPVVTFTSILAPMEVGGYNFTHWTVNGKRIEDAWGQSTNQFDFIFTNNVAAVAHYLPSSQFTADSLVPDWFKIRFYNTTNITAGSDTDGDGFDLNTEYLRGYHPRIWDEITEGGISRRRSALLTLSLYPSVFTVRQISEPSGIFSNYWRFPQITNLNLATSPTAAGYSFVGWFNGAQRLDDPLSLATNVMVTITNDTTIVGRFVAINADTDGDALPDSFELFNLNTLEFSGNSDPDGDGFNLNTECLRGYSPVLTDEITEGGISRRRSALLTLNLYPKVLTVRQISEPFGIFSNYWRFPQVTNLNLATSPTAAGYSFVGWFIGAKRLDDPLSLATNITVPITDDTTIVGRFAANNADTDGDALPDSFELFNLNTLEFSGNSDPDGDGYNLITEYLRAYSPVVADEITEGGISRRRSSMLFFAPPPPEIIQQPMGANVVEGTGVTLHTQARGMGSFRYQWRLNGINLAGETNDTLHIPSVTLTNSGGYSVAVASPYGAVNSDIAVVMIQVDDLTMTDNFSNAVVFTSPSGLGKTANLAATREPGEPAHNGKPGTNSIWLSWRAPAAGLVTFSTRGSSFDTLLAVYVGDSLSSLERVTSDDDGGGYYTSAASFTATNGVLYHIAVDGLTGAHGQILLMWNQEAVVSDFPRFTAQPASRTVAAGSVVSFQAQVACRAPVSYQWYFNNQVVPGAGSETLLLDNVGQARLGIYKVAVASGLLTNWSEPASLQIGTHSLAAFKDKIGDLYQFTTPRVSRLGEKVPLPGYQRMFGGGFGIEPITVSVSQGVPGAQNFSTFNSRTEAGEVNMAGQILEASQWLILNADRAGDLLFAARCSVSSFVLAAYRLADVDLEGNLPQVGATNVVGNSCWIRFPVQAGAKYLVGLGIATRQTATFNAIWTMDATPMVCVQPEPQSILEGQTLSLNAWAAGFSIQSYQWRFNGFNIPGATNEIYTQTSARTNLSGLYDLVVSGAGGSTTSAVARVIINAVSPPQPIVFKPVMQLPGGQLQINFTGPAGLAYTLESATNLLNWERIYHGVFDLQSAQWICSPEEKSKFYRVTSP